MGFLWDSMQNVLNVGEFFVIGTLTKFFLNTTVVQIANHPLLSRKQNLTSYTSVCFKGLSLNVSCVARIPAETSVNKRKK